MSALTPLLVVAAARRNPSRSSHQQVINVASTSRYNQNADSRSPASQAVLAAAITGG
ncbi:MAG: hypothetical protein ACRD0K_01605 [Egibacteraceae bacterium]